MVISSSGIPAFSPGPIGLGKSILLQYLPVNNDAREGVQVGEVVTKFVAFIPFAAIPSKNGVLISGLP